MERFENDIITYKNENGIEYIQFKRLLEHGIKHGYTLKKEGIAKIYKTINYEVLSGIGERVPRIFVD